MGMLSSSLLLPIADTNCYLTMNNVLESLRAHHKGDLVDLAKMHLAFLIEVTPEEWQKIVSYVDKEEEEQETAQAKKMSKSSLNDKPVSFSGANQHQPTETYKLNNKFAPPKEKELASNIFGKPLTKESLKQAMLLIDFLNEDENYKLEGIFRKSGTQERQQDLRYMLNNGVRVDLKANRFTAVDTSCVLKDFIQSLPEPLLTNNHFELHFECAKAIRKEIPDSEIKEKNAKRLKIVQLLLHLLPELHREFFISLMALLNRVARSIEVTKMDERSLATIFGQHILCPRSWTPKQIQKNIDIITDAMEFLLLNYDRLFCGPRALVLDAKKKLAKRRGDIVGNMSGDSFSPLSNKQIQQNSDNEDDNENDTVLTFCQRKKSHETITDQALAELYAQVQAMPDTPHKRKLIKQFNRQNGFHKSSSSSKWKSIFKPILGSKH